MVLNKFLSHEYLHIHFRQVGLQALKPRQVYYRPIRKMPLKMVVYKLPSLRNYLKLSLTRRCAHCINWSGVEGGANKDYLFLLLTACKFLPIAEVNTAVLLLQKARADVGSGPAYRSILRSNLNL